MQPIMDTKYNCINSNLFTQFCVTENICISENMPNIEQIISCVVDPEILSIKTIDTMKGISYEGQYLSGKKAVLEFKLKQKILYVAEHCTQSVHVIENEFFQSAYIVIPCKIEGTDPSYLIKHNYLKPKIIMEDIICNQINKRIIMKNICIRIELIMIQTHELCYSIEKNCNYSDVLLSYNSGTNHMLVYNSVFSRNKKPKWSPNGYELAFLTYTNGNWMLFLYSLKTNSVKQITDELNFKSITGFCWTTDGMKLCVTAYDGESKEIYLIESNKSNYMQLTYGNKIYNSCNPKCSPDGKRIGFIRSFCNRYDLWIMNIDGTDCRKVTVDGYVISQDWAKDSMHLAIISNSDDEANILSIINIINDSTATIECNQNIKKRKVKYSPDGQNLAFIGSDNARDNIYIYCIDKKLIYNITEFIYSEKISDFTWNQDGEKIYYSMKDQLYYNIYSIDIYTHFKAQLTFTTALNIELDYRPRIF